MPPFVIIMTLLTSVVCGFAIWKGGAGERLAGIVILGVLAVQLLVDLVAPAEHRPVISLVFDAIPALALLMLVIRHGSPWLGGVMLFYASQFALQSFYLVTERRHDWLHANINNLNFLGIHVCLVVGTIAAMRARGRLPADRPAA